jgi:hypothetical protein
MKKVLIAAAFNVLALLVLGQATQGQEHEHGQQSSAGQSELNATTEAMGRHSHEGHEHMAAHMHMSELRKAQPGDSAKAQQVVDEARTALEKYRDYKVALDEGYRIFLPNVPQKMYHFTNYKYAFEAAFAFHPEHPTSLLYEKHGDDYKLAGVMYTAPKRYNESDLDRRIPLSIAQWHEHVNLCMPPADHKQEALGPKFGLHGSITTKDECDANGGTFHPLVFNWMVHLYPMEKTEAEIWDVGRQAHNHLD